MVDATSSMSREEKSGLASRELPNPKLYIDKETEGEVLTDAPSGKLIKAGRKSRKQKRKHRRTKKLFLKFRKVR